MQNFTVVKERSLFFLFFICKRFLQPLAFFVHDHPSISILWKILALPPSGSLDVLSSVPMCHSAPSGRIPQFAVPGPLLSPANGTQTHPKTWAASSLSHLPLCKWYIRTSYLMFLPGLHHIPGQVTRDPTHQSASQGEQALPFDLRGKTRRQRYSSERIELTSIIT